MQGLTGGAVEPSQGGSESAAPWPAFIVQNESYNRYEVQLALASEQAGEPPAETADEPVLAVNLAEPFDEPGELEAGTAVLVWPSQGVYLFCHKQQAEATGSYWAKVISGSGPAYVVRPQIAAGADSFADDGDDVSAANTWELTVDQDATAAVPAGAIIRVWDEPDAESAMRRFFFYPIHAVYR